MMFLGVFIMLFGLSSAFAGPGWFTIDFGFYNNCYGGGVGEDVSATGKMRLMSHDTVDGTGVGHSLIRAQFLGVGEGLISGTKYVARDNFTSTWNCSTNAPCSADVFTLKELGTLISLDPEVPDLHYRLGGHTTYDPDGNLRVEITWAEIICPNQ